jgi:hypothetical protein
LFRQAQAAPRALAMKSDTGIEHLIGRELSSVEFVMDYVQLKFQGPRLSAIVMPTLQRNGTELREGAPGYRDAVVDLIGQQVVAAAAEDGLAIQLVFSGGTIVQISLRPDDYLHGPEAAILVNSIPRRIRGCGDR